jgi:hypothetical protein
MSIKWLESDLLTQFMVSGKERGRSRCLAACSQRTTSSEKVFSFKYILPIEEQVLRGTRMLVGLIWKSWSLILIRKYISRLLYLETIMCHNLLVPLVLVTRVGGMGHLEGWVEGEVLHLVVHVSSVDIHLDLYISMRATDAPC